MGVRAVNQQMHSYLQLRSQYFRTWRLFAAGLVLVVMLLALTNAAKTPLFAKLVLLFGVGGLASIVATAFTTRREMTRIDCPACGAKFLAHRRCGLPTKCTNCGESAYG